MLASNTRRRVFLAGTTAMLASPGLVFSQTSILRIGQSAPLTGGNADFGKDTRDGALVAFKRINNTGGISGVALSLETLDDGNNPERSGANAQELEKNGALALFGFASATLAIPALKVMNAAKMTMWSPFSGAEIIRKSGKYLISTRASYEQEIQKLTSLWSSSGFKSFGVLFYDDLVGLQNYQSVSRALSGAKLRASEFRIKRNAPVDENTYQALLKDPPDVLIMTTLAEASAALVKGVKERSRAGLIQMSSISFAGNSQLLAKLGYDGEGISMTAVVPHYERRSLAIAADYLADLAKLQPGLSPSYASFESYIAARALGEVLRAVGKKPAREDIAEVAAKLKQVNLNGFIVKTDNTQSYVDTVVIANGKIRA